MSLSTTAPIVVVPASFARSWVSSKVDIRAGSSFALPHAQVVDGHALQAGAHADPGTQPPSRRGEVDCDVGEHPLHRYVAGAADRRLELLVGLLRGHHVPDPGRRVVVVRRGAIPVLDLGAVPAEPVARRDSRRDPECATGFVGPRGGRRRRVALRAGLQPVGVDEQIAARTPVVVRGHERKRRSKPEPEFGAQVRLRGQVAGRQREYRQPDPSLHGSSSCYRSTLCRRRRRYGSGPYKFRPTVPPRQSRRNHR